MTNAATVIEDLANGTGARGVELEAMAFLYHSALARALGDKEAEAHFAGRFDEACAKMRAEQGVNRYGRRIEEGAP